MRVRPRTSVAMFSLGWSSLHFKDIVHRDVKGSNLRVSNDGRVMLGDFGAAKKLYECWRTVTETCVK